MPTVVPAGKRIGVELYPYVPAPIVLDELRLADELGYGAIWLGDSQLIWRELYVLIGAAAISTRRALLGVGVTNPVTRHPAVTASAAITLQELSGGRGLLGLGVGYSAVRTLGVPRATRAELADCVRVLRALWRGETVPTPTGQWRLTFAAADLAPSILIGATAPRMLALAGAIADGVIITGQVCHPPTLRAQQEHVARGRGVADRPFWTCIGLPASVHADRTRALAAVRPHVAQGLRSPSAVLGAAARAARDAVDREYDVYEHLHPAARHAAAVPDEIVQEFAIAGTPNECRAQVTALFAQGVDEITIRPYPVEGESRASTMKAFARAVLV